MSNETRDRASVLVPVTADRTRHGGWLKPGQLPILITILSILTFYTLLFVYRENYEFLVYVGVILFFFALIVLTNHRVDYPNPVLWGLAVWATMHLSGGGLYVNGKKLYELMIVPLVGEPYNIFRYDQLVHICGFGVATLVMFYIIKPLIPRNNKRWVALSIVIVMAGLGTGALNEIIEFTATVITPKTGVGGYVNNAVDLVANLLGAVLALIYLIFKEMRSR